MSSSTFFYFFVTILALVLLVVNLIFAPHNPYKEKNAAFECGYTSFLGQSRIQFSISFFIFALLFLLFDLEILLVYPYLVSAYTNETYGLVILFIFLLALTLGFAFELGKKALSIDSKQMHKTNKGNNSNISILPLKFSLPQVNNLLNILNTGSNSIVPNVLNVRYFGSTTFIGGISAATVFTVSITFGLTSYVIYNALGNLLEHRHYNPYIDHRYTVLVDFLRQAQNKLRAAFEQYDNEPEELNRLLRQEGFSTEQPLTWQAFNFLWHQPRLGAGNVMESAVAIAETLAEDIPLSDKRVLPNPIQLSLYYKIVGCGSKITFLWAQEHIHRDDLFGTAREMQGYIDELLDLLT